MGLFDWFTSSYRDMSLYDAVETFYSAGNINTSMYGDGWTRLVYFVNSIRVLREAGMMDDEKFIKLKSELDSVLSQSIDLGEIKHKNKDSIMALLK